MIRENIYIGEIRSKSIEILDEKTIGEQKIYKIKEKNIVENKMAVLYRVYEDHFLQITPATSLKDIKLAELDMSNKTISTSESFERKYVAEETLVPYYEDLEKKKVHYMKFRKDLFLDPRLPIGIDH